MALQRGMDASTRVIGLGSGVSIRLYIPFLFFNSIMRPWAVLCAASSEAHTRPSRIRQTFMGDLKEKEIHPFFHHIVPKTGRRNPTRSTGPRAGFGGEVAAAQSTAPTIYYFLYDSIHSNKDGPTAMIIFMQKQKESAIHIVGAALRSAYEHEMRRHYMNYSMPFYSKNSSENLKLVQMIQK